jgi:hypothetical protein
MIPWWYQAFIIVVDILAFSMVAVVAYRSGRLAERLERESDAEETHQNSGPSSV